MLEDHGHLAEDALTQSCHERKIGDLVSADHKILSEESESRDNHRYAVVVQDLATQRLQSYPCKTRNFPGFPEEPDEVPGADKETKSHLH